MDEEILDRFNRQPDRKVFEIDVGNLPREDVEKYVRELMKKFRDKGFGEDTWISQ